MKSFVLLPKMSCSSCSEALKMFFREWKRKRRAFAVAGPMEGKPSRMN